MRTTLVVNPYASRVADELAERVAQLVGAVEVLRTERRGHFVVHGSGRSRSPTRSADFETPRKITRPG